MSALTHRVTSLLHVTHTACNALAPMVLGFYQAISGETAKAKADASIFTIADGIVQYLLVNHLFQGEKFLAIVGEEDENNVNIKMAPYTVDDLVVPEQFYPIIDEARLALDSLGSSIEGTLFKDLNIFIDPIDGTREFSTGLGEQCSICVGFSDSTGYPVGGIVYRPITLPPTYAMGSKLENFVESNLDIAETPNPTGFLTSNGAISPFIQRLISKLEYTRVPSGGAGNKMLMLLEGKGAAYIQDRGVSRWGKFLRDHVFMIEE
jgi:3'-phosphoadenosine 5'-phosphosulfate (PAPS) 3'-phosphatase